MRYKALVVDDQESVRTLLARILEDEGYDVAQASCGKDGIKAVKLYEPDVVFSDVNMLGMSGLEMAAQIRERNYKVKICLISGTRPERLPEDVDGFIQKPFEINDIRAMLSDLFSDQPR